MKTLNDKLVDIQGRLKAPKNQRNSFGNYNYRSCEDILEALKPLLIEHNLRLTITDDTVEIAGIVFIDAEAMISDGSNSVSSRAQAGINLNKKGMDIAQSFGASSSYARKYALNGLFLIDDTKDADTNEHQKKVTKPKVDHEKEMKALKSRDELVKYWKTLNPTQQKALTLLKDKLKLELA